MPNITEPITECQKCGGELWDNRKNKKNPKGPDFKCKDKDCGDAYWLKTDDSKPVKKSAPRPGITVNALAEKMNDAYEALQLAGFGTELITLDVCYKVAFTVLKDGS